MKRLSGRVSALAFVMIMVVSLMGCGMYLDGDFVEYEDTLVYSTDSSEGEENSVSESGSPEDIQTGEGEAVSEAVGAESESAGVETGSGVVESSQEASTEVEEVTVAEIRFRNQNLLEQHYEKHGIEMGFASAEEYELAAYKVIINSESLHKIEAEDGDDVYYLESTNEFVIVSGDGYIRTYFNPSAGIDYFNRQ